MYYWNLDFSLFIKHVAKGDFLLEPIWQGSSDCIYLATRSSQIHIHISFV